MKLQEISIEITQQCPNYCIHCSSYSSWKQVQSMPYELVCAVIGEAVDLGAKKVCISGGEPFLHPQLVEIVNHVWGLGAKCVIYTSGIYYDSDTYQSIPKNILRDVKEQLEAIIINYEAADSETYDTIMGTQFLGYDLMRQTIASAVSVGINVETHVVPMKINYQQIPQIIQQCTELGVSKVSFLRMVKHGRVLDNQELTFLTEEEERIVTEQFKNFRDKNGVAIRLGIPYTDCVKRMNCRTGIAKLNIRYDGLVYPCEAFKNDLPEGFVLSRPDSVYEKSLKDIYEHSRYLIEIRNKLKKFQMKQCDENCMNQYFVKMKE